MARAMSVSPGLLLIIVLMSAGVAQAQGVFVAGDLWDSFLPTNVGKPYYENESDPNSIYHLFAVGNFDRQWTVPTQMYPGGENLHIPWKQEIEMVEYNPDPEFNALTSSLDPRARFYAHAFETPDVIGERSTDAEARWVDPMKRHQAIYEGRMPTNLGIDVKYRIRQFTLNHANMNDFIAIELELTNTGVLDVNGDLSCGVSTSGAALKLPGRVGDSPIIGAGSFVDNDVGGAIATGMGEHVIRFAGASAIVENMRHGMSPEEACRDVIDRMSSKIQDPNVVFTVLNKDGRYASVGTCGLKSFVSSQGQIAEIERVHIQSEE